MEVIVREIEEKDFQKVYQFLKEYSQIDLPYKEFSLLLKEKKVLGAVAIEEDEIIGILTTDFKRLPRFDAEGSGWYLNDYILIKHKFDYDIIKALYTKCLSLIPVSEVVVVSLQVNDFETDLIKFLLENGFEFSEDRKLKMQAVWG